MKEVVGRVFETADLEEELQQEEEHLQQHVRLKFTFKLLLLFLNTTCTNHLTTIFVFGNIN